MATDPLDTVAGEGLRAHHAEIAGHHLRDLLHDPVRIGDMTMLCGPLTVDFSRMRGDARTLDRLAALAVGLEIPARLGAMVRGDIVNVTEHRPALHTALRTPAGQQVHVEGVDVIPEVVAMQSRVSDFVEVVTSGRRPGFSGDPITDAVVIGIGGSDLGPRMVAAATRAHHAGVRVNFVANVDPAELDAVLPSLSPGKTLVVVISKTFTTVETLANARAARAWLLGAMSEADLSHHLCAVTTAVDDAVEFGVSPDAVFGFWDWVGGRYSLSSPVGIGIELALGRSGMQSLRDGMHAVDATLTHTSTERNPVVLLGMLDVWYAGLFGTASKAVVPYAQDLALLPAHLQQLQMESNGKSVTESGEPVTWATSPVVWGAPGTNGQHAFFQLLHQGTHMVPVDLIGVRSIGGDERGDLLQANLLAQAAALALGQTAAALEAAHVEPELVSHKVMPGNRPSTLIWLPDLSPHSVGALIALYEHATVVSGLAWGIDPFDQWGVERGKELASGLLPAVSGGGEPHDVDAATLASLNHLRRGGP